jgi:hypothetical protein
MTVLRGHHLYVPEWSECLAIAKRYVAVNGASDLVSQGEAEGPDEVTSLASGDLNAFGTKQKLSAAIVWIYFLSEESREQKVSHNLSTIKVKRRTFLQPA